MDVNAEAAEGIPFSEHRLAECLDEGFRRSRGLLRGGLLKHWVFLLLLTLVAGVWIARSAWDETLLGGAEGLPRDLLLTSGLLRLGLACLQGVLAVDLAWHAQELSRADLPRAASRRRSLLLGVPLALLVTGLAFVPEFLLLGPSLARGDTTLLPGAWWDFRHPGLHAAVLLMGILFWPLARLAPSVLAAEGGGPLRAVWRSFLMVFGSQGKAHGVLASFLLIHLALAFGIAGLLGGLLGEPGNAWSEEALDLGIASGSAFSATLLSVAMMLVEVLLAPQREIAFFTAYVDVRVRREGLDVLAHGAAAGLIPGRRTA